MPEYVPVRARKYRYKQFAAKYVKTGCNGLQSVLECGFTNNPGSAKTIASRLLTYVDVQSNIQKHMDKSKASADDVLVKLSSIANQEAEFKGSDIVKANELLAKHHGLIKERIESTSTVTTIDPVSINRSIDKIASKTHQPKSIIAQEFLEEWSKTDDPDYDAALHHAIQEIVNSLPVEQIPEQITEIGDQ